MTYITGVVARLTRRVPLVQQKLPTLPEHLSSPGFSGVRVLDLLLYVYVLWITVCPFSLAIVFSVLRFTDFDYLFGIFTLLLT